MKTLILALLILSTPTYADLGSFIIGTMVGSSGNKTEPQKKSIAEVEAEEFINTFYTRRFYEGYKYTKNIDVLFDDRKNQEALLLASYNMPTFDKDGDFIRHIRVTNYVLMKSDGERIYNVYCLCDRASVETQLKNKNFFKNKKVLLEFVEDKSIGQ